MSDKDKIIESVSDETLDKWHREGLRRGLEAPQVTLERAREIVQGLCQHLLEQPTPAEVLLVGSPQAAWREVARREQMPEGTEPIWPEIDGHWFSFFFARTECYIELGCADIAEWPAYRAYSATQEVDVVYPMTGYCVVSQPPVRIELKDENLHCDDRPAVEYPDGWSVFALNGVRVPREVVMTPPSRMDRQFLLKYLVSAAMNVEVRREVLRKVGIERVVAELQAVTLDSLSIWVDAECNVYLEDDGGHGAPLRELPYTLLEIPVGPDAPPLRALKMRNPSIDVWHVETVPPTISSVMAALEFRNGVAGIPAKLA